MWQTWVSYARGSGKHDCLLEEFGVIILLPNKASNTLLGGLPASLAQLNQVYHLSQTRVVFQVDG